MRTRWIAAVIILLVPLVCRAGLVFDFQYGTGEEYWTANRKAALSEAANMLAAYLSVPAPRTLTFSVTGQNTNSGILASAGSGLYAFPGFNKTIVQQKIQTGVDLNGASDDGTINWNFFHSWDTGDSVGAGSYDFKAVAMHELMHTFGFLSLVDSAGNNTENYWADFDKFLVDSNGDSPIGNGTYLWNAAYDTNLTGGNGGLYFGGANAVAAFGGLVPLYTPNSWMSGSSVSHLDTTFFTGVDRKMMNHSLSTGAGVRTLSVIELGMLADLGYSLASTAVPEPSTWWMALLTGAWVGIYVIRRKKQKGVRN